MGDALIYGGVRSPRTRARKDGALAAITPHALLAQLYGALTERTGLAPAAVEDVLLGCVTQQGEQAGNIARASVLYAGWPDQVPGLTLNRYCASGLDAVALAALKIQGGARQLVAGGVEMMSRVPMLSDGARVFTDPEFASRCRMLMMGSGADLIASRAGVSRAEADRVAYESQQRAAAARDSGLFDASLVSIRTPAGEARVDECIRDDTTMERLAAMPPAFAELGAAGVDALQLAASPGLDEVRHIHTAGNSPAMADAACLLLLGDAGLASQLGRKARARVVGSVSIAADPLEVLSGCLAATDALLARSGLHPDEVDLFEIHEAFAAVSVLAARRFGLDADRLNVNGGVIALGHPMGATGAIMCLTLLDELERRGLKRGVVAAAGAAGSGSALLIERCP
jgi:acetyl-CoA C-acetyltransferase